MKPNGVCDTAAKMLQNEGFCVAVATTLRSALSQVSSDTDLVVAGLELEDISGADLLTYLKNDPLREQIPFVFLVHKKKCAQPGQKRVFTTRCQGSHILPHW